MLLRWKTPMAEKTTIDVHYPLFVFQLFDTPLVFACSLEGPNPIWRGVTMKYTDVEERILRSAYIAGWESGGTYSSACFMGWCNCLQTSDKTSQWCLVAYCVGQWGSPQKASPRMVWWEGLAIQPCQSDVGQNPFMPKHHGLSKVPLAQPKAMFFQRKSGQPRQRFFGGKQVLDSCNFARPHFWEAFLPESLFLSPLYLGPTSGRDFFSLDAVDPCSFMLGGLKQISRIWHSVIALEATSSSTAITMRYGNPIPPSRAGSLKSTVFCRKFFVFPVSAGSNRATSASSMDCSSATGVSKARTK